MVGRTVTSVFPGRCWLSLSSDRSPPFLCLKWWLLPARLASFDPRPFRRLIPLLLRPPLRRSLSITFFVFGLMLPAL